MFRCEEPPPGVVFQVVRDEVAWQEIDGQWRQVRVIKELNLISCGPVHPEPWIDGDVWLHATLLSECGGSRQVALEPGAAPESPRE